MHKWEGLITYISFKNIRDSAIKPIFMEVTKKQHDLEYLTLFL